MDTIRSLNGLDRIVLFDGVCKFCNDSVNFILRKENDDTLRFVSLQSSLGAEILKKYNLPSDYTESILFLNNNTLYTKSRAVLHISKFLKMPWSLGSIFLIIPSLLSDVCYDMFARNRYRWFGKTDACMIPPTNHKLRFLN